MNMFWALVFIPAGFAIIVKGANWLINGSVGLADKFGISGLVIGLTVVAMGTSAPEAATSISTALRGMGSTAIGNIYGSNIANLALIGGICALIRPIRIRVSVTWREMPIMLIAALSLWPILSLDGAISRYEAGFLLLFFVAAMWFSVYMARRDERMRLQKADVFDDEIEVKHSKQNKLAVDIVFILLGFAALAIGAHLATQGAGFVGRRIGLSEAVVGLTILAIGTSLPELVTCVIAALKGHDDLSIGNLVGSNIFNTLLVVGAAGMARPFSMLPSRLTGVDYWIMIGVSGVFVAIAFVKKGISRASGVILMVGYIAYMVYVCIFTPGV